MNEGTVIWSMVGSGGLLGLLRLFDLNRAWCKPVLFNAVVKRLCAAGNLPRALKLCRGSEPVAYAGAMVGVLTLLEKRRQESPHPFGLETALQEAFTQGLAAQRERLQRNNWVSYIGALSILGAVFLTAQRSQPTLFWVCVAAAAALVLAALLGVPYIIQACADGFPALLPRLLEAPATPPPSDKPPEKRTEAAPAPAGATHMEELVVSVYQGDRPVQEHVFRDAIIKIGKVPSAHLRFDDSSVSRMHAVIEHIEDGQWRIMDLGSDNGTWVNGEKVTRCVLRQGDELRFGNMRARVGPADKSVLDALTNPEPAAPAEERSDPDAAPAQPQNQSQEQERDHPCPSCGQNRFLRVPAMRPGGWRPGDATPLTPEFCETWVCRGCGRVEWILADAVKN